MANKNTYTEKDIIVLNDREHVRLRTQIYLGNTKKTSYKVPLFNNDKIEIKTIEFVPAVYKAIGEIIDNSIDEFARAKIASPTLTIEAEPLLGTYTISDNGRGVPIDMHEVGQHTPQVAFGQLRSGRNFTNEKDVGVIGQNGVGSACTNFCSTQFSVDIRRDGKRYQQTFSNGGLEVSKPSIKSSQSDNTGTSVTFELDGSVFDDISLPLELIENRAKEIALTNPGVAVEYNKKKYKYKNGFADLIKNISSHFFKFENAQMEFYVIFDLHQGNEEEMFTWVNSSLLFDGGLCNTQFLNAFYDQIISHLSKEAKKQKCDITKGDIRTNLLVLANLKLSDPQYDSQSKTRLTGPTLRKEIVDLLETNWKQFARHNKEWLEHILQEAIDRNNFNANKQAIKAHEKQLRRRIDGLKDATSQNRFECQLLITEGDSAASMITNARDPKTTAALPLRGKVNNVYGCTVAQLLQMGKISDMLTAIGLVPGKKAIRSDLRYGKIIIATDADVDGGDIFTLLVNLFFQFWPELFDPQYPPIVHRLVAPNICLTKGKNRVHVTSMSEYHKIKDNYKGWTVEYYKGLGRMVQADWEMILSGDSKMMIPITNDGKMIDTFTLLFSPDADARKNWLQK